MVKYRNVEVKIRGGGSRIQRAMVLASGKLKFVKNKVKHRSSKVSHTKTKTRSVKYMTKKKNRNGNGKSFAKSAERIMGGVALAAPAAITLWEFKDTSDHGLKALVARYTPYDPDKGWNLGGMLYGWGPYAGFKLAALGYHKAMGLIRRL